MTAQLERKLGLWACISIVAGAVIGSSIFMKPATMAGQLGSPLLLILVWVIAGIVSIFGGMINAEIGAMIPETGGQYVYFRHMYGKFFAYLYGWASFIVINTAAIAAIAFIFALYTGYFIELPTFDKATEQSFVLTIPFVGKLFPLQNIGVKALAIFLIFLLTFINHRSLKAGGAIQVVFTVIKVAALLFIIFAIFFSGEGSMENFTTTGSEMNFSSAFLITGFVAATSGALAAYDGWNNLGLAGGEVMNPQKNIPRGLIWGLTICIVLYVLTTLAYIYMLPIDEMKNSAMVATDALGKVMGVAGASIIALLVLISTAGSVNGNILSCARVNFAMAQDKVFFPWAAKVDEKYKTPVGALWIQCFWACLFVLTGSFDMLSDLFVFVTWIFYAFAAYGIFILRKKMPGRERPYKLKFYPWAPLIFILFALFYFIVTIYNDISNYLTGKSEIIFSALGLLLLATGIPFYWYFNSRKSRGEKT